MHTRQRRGATIVEVMMVLVIAGVAAGFASGRIRTNVRRARLHSAADLVANSVAIARTVSTTRGCRAVVHLDTEPRPLVWVTSCKRTGDGIDTIAVRRISSYSGFVMSATTSAIRFNANGIRIDRAMTKVVVRERSGELGDSLMIDVMGRVHRL